jgi:hypothetical protein
MESQYGNIKKAIGFDYSPEIMPCAIFKPLLRKEE